MERARELWERDELSEDWKWVDALSRRHQRLFFAEVQFEWGQYCATKETERARIFVEDWIATAETDADPEHAEFLLGEKNRDDYEAWGAAN